MLISIITTVVSLIASWMIYKKMGRQGWEGIIPFYNTYVLCEELYGNGWKFLLMLIPLYNIYFAIKLNLDYAYAFNKGTGFAVGMIFLPFIFQLILAFDENAQYRDGSKANTTPDALTRVTDKTKQITTSAASYKQVKRDENALEKIEKLSELKEKGIISDEEFNEKKADLLTKI